MTLIIKRRNGDLFPSLTNDLCSTNSCGTGLLDIDNDLWDGGLKVPLANISETKDDFKVDLSAPGLKRDDFKVEIEDGTLTISSEKKEESKEDKKNYKRREFSYTSFSRSFSLPENVQEDKINAKYDDGMLHVSIPKKQTEQSKPKKSIQVG